MTTTRTGRARSTADDPEFTALIAAVETVLAEWTGPGRVRPHGVAHQDPRTGLLAWHLRGLPDQLDHLHAALRAAEPAEVRLARTLAAIAAIDPSRHGHTGPDTPEIAAAYAQRNALIWTALALAQRGRRPGRRRPRPDRPAPGRGLPGAAHRPGVLAPACPPGGLGWPQHGREVPAGGRLPRGNRRPVVSAVDTDD